MEGWAKWEYQDYVEYIGNNIAYRLWQNPVPAPIESTPAEPVDEEESVEDEYAVIRRQVEEFAAAAGLEYRFTPSPAPPGSENAAPPSEASVDGFETAATDSQASTDSFETACSFVDTASPSSQANATGIETATPTGLRQPRRHQH